MSSYQILASIVYTDSACNGARVHSATAETVVTGLACAYLNSDGKLMVTVRCLECRDGPIGLTPAWQSRP